MLQIQLRALVASAQSSRTHITGLVTCASAQSCMQRRCRLHRRRLHCLAAVQSLLICIMYNDTRQNSGGARRHAAEGARPAQEGFQHVSHLFIHSFCMPRRHLLPAATGGARRHTAEGARLAHERLIWVVRIWRVAPGRLRQRPAQPSSDVCSKEM